MGGLVELTTGVFNLTALDTRRWPAVQPLASSSAPGSSCLHCVRPSACSWREGEKARENRISRVCTNWAARQFGTPVCKVCASSGQSEATGVRLFSLLTSRHDTSDCRLAVVR